MGNRSVKLEIYIGLCVLFLLLGFFNSFNLWSQIIDFYKLGEVSEVSEVSEVVGLDQLPFVEYYHYPRALLFLPLVVILKISGISLDFLFKVYTSIFLVLSIYTQYLSVVHIWRASGLISRLFVLLIMPFYFVLSQYMNGRLVYAFLGFSILNYMLLRFYKLSSFKAFCLYFLSAWFCSVSSGAFLVCFLVLLIHCYYFYSRSTSVLSIIMPILLSLPLLLLGIAKNLKFYNYSFIGLLKHGFGNNAVFVAVVAVFVVLLILYLMYYLNLGKKLKISTILIYSALISLGLSVMGRSILASQLPTFVLICFIIIFPWFRKQFPKYVKSQYTNYEEI